MDLHSIIVKGWEVDLGITLDPCMQNVQKQKLTSTEYNSRNITETATNTLHTKWQEKFDQQFTENRLTKLKTIIHFWNKHLETKCIESMHIHI